MAPSLTHLSNDGAWCWFQDPRAIRYVDNHDRSYLGWITSDGDIQVGWFDHDSGETTKTTLHEQFEPDDHDAPSLYIRPDGRIVVFYTRHSGPDIRYRISHEAERLSRFGNEQVITPSTDHTYPNPQYLADQERTYLFYRNANRNLAYITSTDRCETWSEERELVTTSGWAGIRDAWVYFKIDGNGADRIDIGLTHYDYASSPSPYRDIRYLRFDGTQGQSVTGKPIRSNSELPIGFRDCPVVYDASATRWYSWIWDCATHPDGPALVYAELRDNDDHRYRYARWDGSNWIDTELCVGGNTIKDQHIGAYSGGVYLDHTDPTTCYVAVGDNSGSRIQRWETPNDGSTWTVTDLTEDRLQNIRPVVPRNRHANVPVIWMRGRYDDYDEGAFETALVTTGTGW